MAYWDVDDGGCTDWAQLLDDFLAHRTDADGQERGLWMGMHALDNGFEIERIYDRVELARTRGAPGTMLFASAYLDDEAGTTAWDAMRAGPFAVESSVPRITWR
jgi:hypothetical protein